MGLEVKAVFGILGVVTRGLSAAGAVAALFWERVCRGGAEGAKGAGVNGDDAHVNGKDAAWERMVDSSKLLGVLPLLSATSAFIHVKLLVFVESL